MKKSRRLEKVLSETIDDVLLILGNDSKNLIYRHIETKYKIELDGLPKRLQTLHKTLEELIGVKSARLLEGMIVKSLYGKLCLNLEEHEDWTLIDYVEFAKKARERPKIEEE